MRIIKKALKIFWLILVAIMTLMFATALVIQLPQIQTFVIGKVVDKLDDKLDAEIRIGKIHFLPFRTLFIKNVLIIDRNPSADALDPSKEKIDTFFRAEFITARFSWESLTKHQAVHLDKAIVENAQMNLVLENKEDTGNGDITSDNLSRIFRLKKPAVCMSYRTL